MRKLKVIGIVIAAALLAMMSTSFAQPMGGMGGPVGGGRGMGGSGGRGGGGYGGRGGSGALYNAQTVLTISGEVKAVERVTPQSGTSYDVYLIVQMDAGPIDVYLGPGWYVDSRDVKIQAGDTVEIKGSKVSSQGNPSLIAAEVTRGGDVLVFRDVNTGTPAWSGAKNIDQM